MGWLVTLEGSSRPTKNEAGDSGFYSSPWGQRPRIQIRTISELFDGRGFNCPPIRPSGATLRLPRRVMREGDQGSLL